MSSMLDLIALTVRAPAEVSDRLVDLRLGRQNGWLALVATMVVTAITMSALSGGGAVQLMPGLPMFGPLPFALILVLLSVGTVFAIFTIARAMGGTGDFEDVIVHSAWGQVAVLMVQVAQVIAFFVMPGLAGILALLGFGFIIWVWLHLFNRLMGFESLGKTGLMLLLAQLSVGIGLAIILALLGVDPTGGSA